MNLSKSIVEKATAQYGDAFYVLDTEQFELNFNELISSFRRYYENFHIAYSYKTNYIPRLCQIVDQLGGYAEVVSHMEMEIAERIGVPYEKIEFNGPYKDKEAVRKLILKGGMVNIDSFYDYKIVEELAAEYPELKLGVGIRCNFDVEDDVLSRFGFDVAGDDFKTVVNNIKNSENLYLKGLHCHFANRNLEYWKNRAEGMTQIVLEYMDENLEYVSLGGGLFGKMAESLKQQFTSHIPTYDEYADVVGPIVAAAFGNLPKERQPKVFLEPGSAVVGDAMKFVSKVISIKNVRGKYIATLLGSIYNINPTLNKKNPPLEVIQMSDATSVVYEDLDFGGFTCIESDYLYRNYNGKIAVNDYVIFGNVGSYSVVLKPPFILPNFPVIEVRDEDIILIKNHEKFDDIFHTYKM